MPPSPPCRCIPCRALAPAAPPGCTFGIRPSCSHRKVKVSFVALKRLQRPSLQETADADRPIHSPRMETPLIDGQKLSDLATFAVPADRTTPPHTPGPPISLAQNGKTINRCEKTFRLGHRGVKLGLFRATNHTCATQFTRPEWKDH